VAQITTGRRKEAVARVRLVPGTGSFELNGRSLEDYFPTRAHRMVVASPLRTVGREKELNVIARIEGGGVSGQAGALRLGIARALIELDPELRPVLKKEGSSHAISVRRSGASTASRRLARPRSTRSGSRPHPDPAGATSPSGVVLERALGQVVQLLIGERLLRRVEDHARLDLQGRRNPQVHGAHPIGALTFALEQDRDPFCLKAGSRDLALRDGPRRPHMHEVGAHAPILSRAAAARH